MVDEVRLADLCDSIVDCPHSTPAWTDSGVVVLRNQNIRNGRLDLTAPSYTDEAHFAQRTQRAVPTEGDLVITREAPMGEVCIIPRNLRCCLGQRMVLLRPNRRRADPRYLLYALQSSVVQHEISASEGTGSTVSNLRIPLLESLPIPIQPLSEQRAIAHILGTLDDKIELSSRMSVTLEAMARALFKSWFVDFDPVRAKMEGRDPGLPPHLADLFPERLVESELGEIPEGWRIGVLGDVSEHPRRTVHAEEIESGTPYIALEHMPKRCIALTEWGTADGVGSNKYQFRRGEFLFGKLRPYFHKAGIAPINGVCSTDIVVVTPRAPSWRAYVLGHLSSVEFVDYTDAGSTGTKMPRTSWNYMARYPVVLPPMALAESVAGALDPAFQRIVGTIHESRTLAVLRDTLLPKLISGELRVRDADRMVVRAT